MKYLFVIMIAFCSCSGKTTRNDLDIELSSLGFNKNSWKFDSLACYPQYRRQQAYIIKSNKELLEKYSYIDIERVLGRSFRIEKLNGSFSLNYLLSNEYCCEVLDSLKRSRIDKYGLGAAHLSISFNKDDSSFYDITIGIP